MFSDFMRYIYETHQKIPEEEYDQDIQLNTLLNHLLPVI